MPTTHANDVLHHLRRAALLCGGTELSDGQLLEGFLTRRDEAAFEMLVRRHGPMVLGVCKRVIGNHQDAEDAFQATFLVLARKASSVVPREAVGNWLYGVAYRTARRAKAVASRRWAREKQVRTMPQRTAVPVDALQELEPILDEELSRLPDHYRLPVVLCDLEGRSRKEVAQRLKLPEGTLSSRLATARKMLARRLTRRGVTLSGGVLAMVLAEKTVLASVPLPLVSSTVTAAVKIAAGQAAAAVASAPVVALTEGALRTMLLNKLKVVSVILAAAAILAGITAMSQHAVHAGGQGRADAQARPSVPATAAQGGAPRATKAEPTIVKTDGAVDALAWSPSGKLLATQVRAWEGEGQKTEFTGHAVQLRDAQTGKVLKTLFESDRQAVSSIVLTPDGKSVAAAVHRIDGKRQADIVQLWDVVTGKETLALQGAKAGLQTIACSSDGKLLAGAGRLVGPDGLAHVGEVCLWDLASGKLLWQAEGHANELYGLAFSPDGKFVATGSKDKTIKLWDTEKGTCKRTLEGHGEHGVYSVAFSPDGKLLASGGLDGTVRLWNPETGELKQTLTDGYFKGLMVLVAFSPDGKTLASAGDTAVEPRKGDVKLWDSQSGKLQQTSAGQVEGVYSLAFSPDGATLAVGCWSKKLVLLPVVK
jgi:RNA polymerase sigma factor (sigma-70 family)